MQRNDQIIEQRASTIGRRPDHSLRLPPHPLLATFALLYAIAIVGAVVITRQPAAYLPHVTLLVAGLLALAQILEPARR